MSHTSHWKNLFITSQSLKYFVCHIPDNETFCLSHHIQWTIFACYIPVTDIFYLSDPSHGKMLFVTFQGGIFLFIHNFVFIACDILQNNKEGASYPHRKVNVKVMPGSQIFLHASQLGFFSEWIFWLRHSNWMFGWRTLHHLSRCRVFGYPRLLLQRQPCSFGCHGYLSPPTLVFESWWSIGKDNFTTITLLSR